MISVRRFNPFFALAETNQRTEAFGHRGLPLQRSSGDPLQPAPDRGGGEFI
jgi:hypothetical protein